MSTTITVLADDQPVEVTFDTKEPVVLIPGQGMRIDGPSDYTEIGPRETVPYIENMADDKWKHISTGPLFGELFRDVFPKESNIAWPLPIEQAKRKRLDFGQLHIAGLIIMGFEAMCERGEKIFIRDPETYLHPGQKIHLMTMIHKLNKLGGALGPKKKK